MRVTEYMDFMNRTDIGLSANPKERDYTHFTPRMLNKRERYEYQKKLRQEKKDTIIKKALAEKSAKEIRKYFKKGEK
tara:strand:+ start:283 stop:513 length:231 start_codon:yes stop_codon:yes gene_type:complete